MTLGEEKFSSKPKLFDHEIQPLADYSQRPGQGHSSYARLLGRGPRDGNLLLLLIPITPQGAWACGHRLAGNNPYPLEQCVSPLPAKRPRFVLVPWAIQGRAEVVKSPGGLGHSGSPSGSSTGIITRKDVYLPEIRQARVSWLLLPFSSFFPLLYRTNGTHSAVGTLA